jgi:hypothetical protein
MTIVCEEADSYFGSICCAVGINPPLRAFANGEDGPNGVYSYGAGAFPNRTYNSTNCWVDRLPAIIIT